MLMYIKHLLNHNLIIVSLNKWKLKRKSAFFDFFLTMRMLQLEANEFLS